MEKMVQLGGQDAVIGSLLIDPSICGELFAETAAEDFRNAEFRDVYLAARKLFFEDRPVDPVTILDRMGGGQETRQLLGDLIEITPTSANWREYARVMREETRLFRLRELGRQMWGAATLEEARGLVRQAAETDTESRSGDVVGMTAGLMDFYKRQAEPVNYVRFGFGKLDKNLYASLGDFIVIGGRPSAGKTLFAVQLADTLSRSYRVGFFSLETSPGKIFDRFFAQAVPIDFGRVKRHELQEEDQHALAYHKQRMMKQRLDVIRAGGYTADMIQAETLRRRYEVIFVDYLQLVRTDAKGNRTEEVSAVSRALHTLAQRHGVMVIALAQLSRAPKGMRADPTLSDLRESGQIEQDADVVMLLSLKLVGEDEPDDGDRLLQTVKNKEGTTGRFTLAFDGRHQQLVEYMEMPKYDKPGVKPSIPARETPKRQSEPEQLEMGSSDNEQT